MRPASTLPLLLVTLTPLIGCGDAPPPARLAAPRVSVAALAGALPETPAADDVAVSSASWSPLDGAADRDAACADLAAEVHWQHDAAMATAEWEALAASPAWQHYREAEAAMDACVDEAEGLVNIAQQCRGPLDDLIAADREIAESDEYAAAIATPEAVAMGEALARGTALGCWPSYDDEAEDQDGPFEDGGERG